MARRTEGPWYWKARHAWYMWNNGKQIPLGKHSTEDIPKKNKSGNWSPPEVIVQAFHAAMVEAEKKALPVTTSATFLVAEIIDEFQGWVKANKEPGTAESYERRLGSFLRYLKKEKLLTTLLVSELRPFHIERWIAEHPNWNPGTRRGMMIAIQRSMNWAVKSGRITESPIRHLEKPPQGKRENVITPDFFERMKGYITNPAFLDLVTVCWEVGCRPQEIFAVEASHVDLAGERWVFPEKESKGKKRKRIVYLTPTALEITKRQMVKFPEGKLFRNADDKPWKPYAVNSAFCRLRYHFGKEEMKRLKIKGSKIKDKHKRYAENKKIASRLVKKYALVDFRHSFVQRAIKRGVDPITLANLLGHANTDMIARVYSHLAQDTEFLKSSLDKINPTKSSSA